MPTPGSNKNKCARYRDMRQRERNKKRKLEKHLRKHPEDMKAIETLNLL